MENFIGEFVFNTQYLGTTLFIFFILFCVYKWFKDNPAHTFEEKMHSCCVENFDNKWLTRGAVVCIIGFVLTFMWNPIKTVTPKMSAIEYRERSQIVVPDRVIVETLTLEETQTKLNNKLENK